MSSRTWNANAANRINTGIKATRGATNSNVSVIAWIKSAASPSSLMNITGGNNGSQSFVFHVRDAGGNFTLNHDSSGGASADSSIIQVASIAGERWCIAMTLTPGANGLKFYAGKSVSGALALISQHSGGAAFTSNTSNDALIGVENANGSLGNAFKGELDQVAFFTRVLSLVELKQALSCGVTHAADALWYYQITGASPEPDSSPSASPGVIVGSLPVAADICDNGALPVNSISQLLVCV